MYSIVTYPLCSLSRIISKIYLQSFFFYTIRVVLDPEPDLGTLSTSSVFPGLALDPVINPGWDGSLFNSSAGMFLRVERKLEYMEASHIDRRRTQTVTGAQELSNWSSGPWNHGAVNHQHSVTPNTHISKMFIIISFPTIAVYECFFFSNTT